MDKTHLSDPPLGIHWKPVEELKRSASADLISATTSSLRCTATKWEQCGSLRVLAVCVSELLKLVSIRKANAALLLVYCDHTL